MIFCMIFVLCENADKTREKHQVGARQRKRKSDLPLLSNKTNHHKIQEYQI